MILAYSINARLVCIRTKGHQTGSLAMSRLSVMHITWLDREWLREMYSATVASTIIAVKREPLTAANAVSQWTNWCLRCTVSPPREHLMKRLLFSSIQIQSHRAQPFVEPLLAVGEMVRKMITKNVKSWGIYSKLQVAMEWMTVNLHHVTPGDPP